MWFKVSIVKWAWLRSLQRKRKRLSDQTNRPGENHVRRMDFLSHPENLTCLLSKANSQGFSGKLCHVLIFLFVLKINAVAIWPRFNTGTLILDILVRKNSIFNPNFLLFSCTSGAAKMNLATSLLRQMESTAIFQVTLADRK